VGFAIVERIRDAIALVPTKVWTRGIDADGGNGAGGLPLLEARRRAHARVADRILLLRS